MKKMMISLLTGAAMALLPAFGSGEMLDGTGDKPVAFVGATLHPISGATIEDGTLVVRNGLIEAVGPRGAVSVPAGATVVQAEGMHVLPGLIDSHSHMGVYSWPSVEAHSDGNEMTSPVTPHVRAEDAINLEDTALEKARAGGITSILVLPGSGNMIGGEGVVLKLRPNALLEGMKMKEAPRHLKMAMGENPKRVYGGRGEMPSTRMGIMAKHREVWTKTQEYLDGQKRHAEKLAKYEAELAAYDPAGDKEKPEAPDPPERDRMYEVLGDVLKGEVRLQIHCYRKDDLLDIMRIADEFNFKIAAFHHVLEGYKIADELAERGIGACTWPDWWGFKMEAYDAVPENMAIMANAGVTVALHSDDASMVQRFGYEAAKALKYGMTRQQALESITLNPAKLLGIDEWVGTLENGKQADLAIFDGDPLSIYSRCAMTFIDGRQVFDRAAYEAAMERQVATRTIPSAEVAK